MARFVWQSQLHACMCRPASTTCRITSSHQTPLAPWRDQFLDPKACVNFCRGGSSQNDEFVAFAETGLVDSRVPRAHVFKKVLALMLHNVRQNRGHRNKPWSHQLPHLSSNIVICGFMSGELGTGQNCTVVSVWQSHSGAMLARPPKVGTMAVTDR